MSPRVTLNRNVNSHLYLQHLLITEPTTIELPIKTMPIKGMSGIGFSLRGNVTVSNDSICAYCREFEPQEPYELNQYLVLGGGIGHVISAFQLNTYTEVVAVVAATPRRHTRMPCSILTGNELGYGASAINEKMRGDPQIDDRLKIGVSCLI